MSFVRYCRGERRISTLCVSPIPPTLPPPLCIPPTVSQKAELHTENTTIIPIIPTISCLRPRLETSQQGASPPSSPDRRWKGHFFNMLTPLFVLGVLGVLLHPVQSSTDQITVCIEDDNDLRVDCLVPPTPNKINSYEFSWSTGSKETVLNTNVSGSAPDPQYRDKNYVEELFPYGYRMTMTGYTDSLPHNTTYLCKLSGMVAGVNLEKSQLLPCSAVSVFLRSSWARIACVLLFFYHTHN